MGKFVDVLLECQVTERTNTVVRSGRIVNVLRDSNGRFSRSGADIGSREKKGYRGTQSGEAGRQGRFRGKRSGTISSRERSQLVQSSSGKLGSESALKRRSSGLLGSMQTHARGLILQARTLRKSPHRLIRDLHQNYLNTRDLDNSSTKRAKKIMKILNSINSASKIKSKRGRRGRRGRR